MNKLESICRALAACEWDNIIASDIDLANDPEGRTVSIERGWRSWTKEARAVVKAQLAMIGAKIDTDDPHLEFLALAGAKTWLYWLLEPDDAPDKSLSKKMHEAGFTPRKQGKAVREDE